MIPECPKGDISLGQEASGPNEAAEATRYKLVQLLHKNGEIESAKLVVLSYDEKPGIQAIGLISPDLPPKPDKYPQTARDYELKRFGTLSLLASIDLLTGHVHGTAETWRNGCNPFTPV